MGSRRVSTSLFAHRQLFNHKLQRKAKFTFFITQMLKSKPIAIKTNNLSKIHAYPSPISPSGLEFSPSKFIQNYSLPPSFTESYSLSHELGFGGFGFVYAVTRLVDGQKLACKFIFKSKVSRNSWTSDRELGVCPMEVAVLKNVFFFSFRFHIEISLNTWITLMTTSFAIA